jgi:hypothetical protein
VQQRRRRQRFPHLIPALCAFASASSSSSSSAGISGFSCHPLSLAIPEASSPMCAPAPPFLHVNVPGAPSPALPPLGYLCAVILGQERGGTKCQGRDERKLRQCQVGRCGSSHTQVAQVPGSRTRRPSRAALLIEPAALKTLFSPGSMGTTLPPRSTVPSCSGNGLPWDLVFRALPASRGNWRWIGCPHHPLGFKLGWRQPLGTAGQAPKAPD